MIRISHALASGLLATLFWGLNPAVPAADTEEAQYNVVVNLYNAGQWQAALKKIAEREAQPQLGDAQRARYQYAKGLALEKGGQADAARTAYGTLLEKYPAAAESRRAAVALLYLDYAAKQLDAVIQRYAKLNPKSLAAADQRNAALMYAEALYAQNDLPAALTACQAAVALGADRAAVAGRIFDLCYRTAQHQALLDWSAAGVPGVKDDLVALARAEALLALNQPAAVEAEANKIPAASELHPRACLALAQAYLKLNRPKDATAPLETAVKHMKNPPAPPAAYLALADCLLAAGRAADAEKVLPQVADRAGGLPDRERQELLTQTALLRIRLASEAGDPPRLAQVIAETRAHLPPDQLPEILYLKIFGLAQAAADTALLQTMTDDYPLLRGTAREGAATQIYFAALKKAKRLDEGLKLLEEFLARQPASAEAPRARLELATAALQNADYAKARAVFRELLAAATAREILGAETYAEACYNQAVAAVKQQDYADAVKTLEALAQTKPAAKLGDRTLRLLGQVYATKDDFKNAAATWQGLLAGGQVENEGELREHLAKALFATGDAAGSRAQFALACPLVGGEAKLARDSREIWARALFAAGEFATAAAKYEALHESFNDAPAYAYESAVSHEHAKNWAAAEKWYALAATDRQALPPAYAVALDASVAKVRLQTGTGDRGLAYWLAQLAADAPAANFEAAAGALARITATAGTADSARTRLEALVKEYPVTSPRYYTAGALLLQWLAANAKHADLKPWADKLAADLSANEANLPPQTFGATLAPAMISFFRGEAERLAGKFADALAAYETVLAAYPYNEWPDAAGCRAAECYAALGDPVTAANKWHDVVKSAGTSPAAAPWRELAAEKLKTINQGR